MSCLFRTHPAGPWAPKTSHGPDPAFHGISLTECQGEPDLPGYIAALEPRRAWMRERSRRLRNVTYYSFLPDGRLLTSNGMVFRREGRPAAQSSVNP